MDYFNGTRLVIKFESVHYILSVINTNCLVTLHLPCVQSSWKVGYAAFEQIEDLILFLLNCQNDFKENQVLSLQQTLQ